MIKRKNIQSIIAIFGLICVLSLQFRLIFPYVDYSLHKEYIQKVLCINKSRPQLNCNGKCVLAQRIQKELDAENAEQSAIPQPAKVKIQPLEIIDKALCEVFLMGKFSVSKFITPEMVVSQHVPTIICPPPQDKA